MPSIGARIGLGRCQTSFLQLDRAVCLAFSADNCHRCDEIGTQAGSSCHLNICSGYPLECSGLLLARADERGEWVGVGVHSLLEQAVEELASAT